MKVFDVGIRLGSTMSYKPRGDAKGTTIVLLYNATFMYLV